MRHTHKVDRVALHRYLHRKLKGRASPIDKVKLGAELNVTPPHMGRIIKELVDAGRLTYIGRGRHNIAIYRSVNPDKFSDDHVGPVPKVEEEPKPRSRVLVWG